MTLIFFPEKRDLMQHVAHQCICMQYLLELAKQLETDPRACISSFFTKYSLSEGNAVLYQENPSFDKCHKLLINMNLLII